MLRVILADGGPRFCSLLKDTIRWNELGLELAGEAADGQAAVDAALHAKADVLITDVQLPGMDGLTVIRQLRELCPACRFIIVSEHAEFCYTQAAIRLGVSDYLLKPLDGEELNAALASLADSMTRSRQADEAQIRRKKLVSVLRGQRWLHSAEQANRDYGTRFSQTGQYMVLRLAVCRATESSGATELAETVMRELKGALSPLCTDLETFMLSRLRYAMLLQVEPAELERFRRTAEETYLALTRAGFEVDVFDVEHSTLHDTEIPEDTIRAKYDVIMYFSNVINASYQTVTRIQWKGAVAQDGPFYVKEVPTLFVSLGNPYGFVDVPMIRTIINAYNASPYTVQAVVDRITGKEPFTGLSPVDPFCGMFGKDI
ncbi:MAG: response regulator [Oscillospiraceae bacterium]|nr:response regulator [Oscillospiraceae bacterium]